MGIYMEKRSDAEGSAATAGFPATAPEAVSVEDIAPYLRALQLARADLLSGQILGQRMSSTVDHAVDSLLDQFYSEKPNRGRVIVL
jgi:hypothetical protein